MFGSSFSLIIALAGVAYQDMSSGFRGCNKARAGIGRLEGEDLWDLLEIGAEVLEYCHGFSCRAGDKTGGRDLGEQREKPHFPMNIKNGNHC